MLAGNLQKRVHGDQIRGCWGNAWRAMMVGHQAGSTMATARATLNMQPANRLQLVLTASASGRARGRHA